MNDAAEGGPDPFEVTYRTVDDLAIAYSQFLLQGRIFIPCDGSPPKEGSTVGVLVQLPTGARVKTMAIVVNSPAQNGALVGALAELFDDDELVERVAQALSDSHDRIEREEDTSPFATILVVDDEQLERERLAKLLATEGYTVVSAANGADALGKAIQSKPDLIVTDVHMPTMDGWQLLRMIRARQDFKAMGVIFLTALKSDEERLRGYRMGVDDFLPKPVTPEELRLRIQRVLRDRRQEANNDSLRGDLGKVALSSLLSLIEMERRTGYLSLRRDSENASIHVRGGKITDVVLTGEPDSLPALERLFYLLDWTSGTFELTEAESVPDAGDTTAISFALLEHARRTDEASQ